MFKPAIIITVTNNITSIQNKINKIAYKMGDIRREMRINTNKTTGGKNLH